MKTPSDDDPPEGDEELWPGTPPLFTGPSRLTRVFIVLSAHHNNPSRLKWHHHQGNHNSLTFKDLGIRTG